MNQMKAHKKRQLKQNLTGYAFILPNIVGVTLFTLIPMIYSLIISFTDWDYTKGFGNFNWVGIKNYIDMWSDNWFITSLINTIEFAIVVVPCTIVFSLKRKRTLVCIEKIKQTPNKYPRKAGTPVKKPL